MHTGNSRTILLVEDDPAVRKLVAGVLESKAYLVLQAANGEQALAAAGAHPGEIHLIITDFGLGRMNGLQMAARMAETRPGMGVLLISGYAEIPVPPELRGTLRMEFMAKPFSMEVFLDKVAAMLAHEGGVSN